MSTAKKSANHAKWQSLIEEQEKSGLSQAEFCKKRNIAIAQFGYYRGLLKSKDQSKLRKPEVFSPIQIKKQDIKSSDEIKIVLPNGFQCYFPSSIDSMQIKRLMEALLSC